MAAKKSDMEIAEESRKKTIRALAEAQIDNNSDVVKLLNSMALRASAFSIREQQLKEKHRLEEVERDFEKRMDMLTEIDRLKEIQRREQEAEEKLLKRVKDRDVINEQIEVRRRMKVLEMEAQEQEKIAMRNTMSKYKEEDAAIAAERRVLVEKSKAEVLRANAASIELKKSLREKDKQEMADILIYQAQRDAELKKREDEEAENERLKKDRQLKLLLQQEKAQNNAGMLDELRARRAAEEKERQARAKEKEEARKRKADIDELMEARAKQAADKHKRKEFESKLAQQEIIDGIQYSQKMAERERLEREQKKRLADDHREKLNSQIEEVRRRRASERAPEDTLHQELVREEAKLRVIRDRMVQDLIEEGVDPKYLHEMKQVDIGKMLRR